MYLLIDPSLDSKLRLNLFNNHNSSGLIREVKAENFLETIDSFLSKQDIMLSKLEGIAVVVGEGKFTATRIATVIANTFKFADNKLKLLALGSDEVERGSNKKDIQNLSGLIEKFKVGEDNYLSAMYSGKPNIN